MIFITFLVFIVVNYSLPDRSTLFLRIRFSPQIISLAVNSGRRQIATPMIQCLKMTNLRTLKAAAVGAVVVVVMTVATHPKP